MEPNEARNRLEACSTTIREAEAMLRTLSSAYLTSTSNFDELLVSKGLNASRALQQCALDLDRLAKSLQESRRMQQPTRESNTNKAESKFDRESYPLFFIKDGSLYKIGRKGKADERGVRGIWWKSLDVHEAKEVMDTIMSYGSDSFKLTELKERYDTAYGKDIPVYRIDIVVTALKRFGYIDTPRRGFYRQNNGDPSIWMEKIRSQPERGDLL